MNDEQKPFSESGNSPPSAPKKPKPFQHPRYDDELERVPIPRPVVRYLMRKISERGKPYLCPPRRRDWRLMAMADEAGCYWLLMQPDYCPHLITSVAFLKVHNESEEFQPDQACNVLFSYTALLFDRGPRRFVDERDGRELGTVTIRDGMACVSGPLALSCLSYYLGHSQRGQQVVLP